MEITLQNKNTYYGPVSFILFESRLNNKAESISQNTVELLPI